MTSRDHRPRVAFLGYPHHARGGISQFGRQLAEAVGEHAAVRLVGYRKLYPGFTRPGRQAADPSVRRSSLTGAAIPVPWLPWTWRATSDHLAAFRPDLLVVQWWSPFFGPCVRSVLRRARVDGTVSLVVVHNDRPHEAFPFWRVITRGTLAQADHLAAFSPTVADGVRRMLPASEVHVRPYPPLIKMSGDDRGRWDDRLGPPVGRVILFFGNVRAYKGLADLVAALPLVRRRIDATLVVAGTFMEPLERYRKQAGELGIEEHIRFIPEYVPDEEVAELFARSDVVALPYRSATTSGIVSQAAGASKPVVATAVGSLPGMIGERGILVPPCDPGALADGLVRALREPPPPPIVDAGAWEDWRELVLDCTRRGR
jgi:glycosyltransferase involved in cell wall biosynthesis